MTYSLAFDMINKLGYYGQISLSFANSCPGVTSLWNIPSTFPKETVKSNEIVRLSRSLIPLFDTRVDNRVKFNITRLKSWWQLLLVQAAFWEISDYLITTRARGENSNQRQYRQKDEFSPWEYW